MKLDLHRHTLNVAGPEGPAPSLIKGTAGLAPPASLLTTKPAVDVPLTVITAPGTVSVFANTTLASKGPYPLVVSTGIPASTISPTTGFQLLLPDKGTAPVPGGVGCHGSAPVLAPTSVTIASAPPTTLALHAVPVKGTGRAGVDGVLGLNYLGTNPIVIVNYVQATLVQADG